MQKGDSGSVWQIWVDTGGTFTDCLALDPEMGLHRVKVLSSSTLRGSIIRRVDARTLQIREKWHAPKNFICGFEFAILGSGDNTAIVEFYDPAEGLLGLDRAPRVVPENAVFEVRSPEEAPVLAIRLVTGSLPGQPLPPIAMRLATTRGTNALLERRGSSVALFITKGFADLLRIGTQQRPELFALCIEKPEPFYEMVVEVPERLNADGSVLHPLDLEALQPAIAAAKARGIQSAAVALLHSYLNPEHERRLADALLAAGIRHISISSELAPFIKFLPRAETTVIDAYLAPVIRDYLAGVADALSQGSLHVMTSAGGLVQARDYRAMDSLLSGPAGGVVGAAHAARHAGHTKIIAFDMGGTSTDASRFDGDFEYEFELRVGEAHIIAPTLAIESVAAGGGSICWFDGRRFRVGPQSAEAEPGPACYGAGGPLSITDVNLLLGRLDPERFEIPLQPEKAERALAVLLQAVHAQTGEQVDKTTALLGFLAIANEHMADAIRRISVRKGYDPADYALLAFGGAGGQHACAVAQLLGIQTILIPADASLLSAAGIGQARIERFANRQVLQPLHVAATELHNLLAELEREAIGEVEKEGIARRQIEIRRRLIHLRYTGQESSLAIEIDDPATIEEAFLARYQAIYGYVSEGREIEIESLRVIASQKQEAIKPIEEAGPVRWPQPAGRRRTFVERSWRRVDTYERHQLEPGDGVRGPAMIFERHSAIFVDAGWIGWMARHGAMIMQLQQESMR